MKEKLIRLFVRLRFRIRCHGYSTLSNDATGCLVICNHQASIDLLVLATILPEKSWFIVSKQMFPSRFIRWCLSWVNFIDVDSLLDQDWKPLTSHLQHGGIAAFFPELTPSSDGSFAKMNEAPLHSVQQAAAVVVAVYLSGSQYHQSSSREPSLPRTAFPKISLTILPPEKAGKIFYDLLSLALVSHFKGHGSLWGALCRVSRIYGHSRVVVTDSTGASLTYRQIFVRSLILGSIIAKRSKEKELIGLLLPTSAGGLITFFALQAYGRTPAMLNFTSGDKSLLSACKTGGIKTILTSKLFIKKAGLSPMIDKLGYGVTVLFLEDLRQEVGLSQKILGLMASFWPESRLSAVAAKAEDRAVVLFTSGSEGEPKGVALSFENILCNLQQIRSRIALNSDDIFFNVLPQFHAFGLTVGTLAPLLAGVRAHYHPSPLDYKKIPEIAYQIKATILAGTNTFLSGYGRSANPYDFHTIRLVVAGAEALREETRMLWMEKFGIRIFQGYGATEASPVIAVNSAAFNKAKTVGRFLPGIEYRLLKVPGIQDGGRLLLKGVNIMQGYLQPGVGGKAEMPETELGPGWYDSGDVVVVDELGYITIVGRVKRFAKIGGEMISLAMVETCAATVWPDHQHAVVAMPDTRKGECLYLATTKHEANRNDLLKHLKESGFSTIYLPSHIIQVEEIAVNGSGKTDYSKVTAQIVALKQT
ncbi:MAG: AMP-binding protein [Magnetococcales bacterium]|nr:AMP-binding protein [Magnetococcales bacterium]